MLNILNTYTKFIKENHINIDYHFGEASFGNDMVSVLEFILGEFKHTDVNPM